MWIMKSPSGATSGADTLNFLWKDPARQTYIMDNHLAALWCWLKELSPDEQYTLFHIDWHWDAAAMPPEYLPCLAACDNLDSFLALRSNDPGHAMVRWDNYIHPLFTLRPGLLEAFFTVHQANPPSWLLEDERICVHSVESFFYHLKTNFQDARGRLLINLDLDYFFLSMAASHVRAFTDEFLVELVRLIRTTSRADSILTVAWSPECCGGWDQAAAVCRVLCRELDIACPADSLLPQGAR